MSRCGGALAIAIAMLLWSSWGVFMRWLAGPAWVVTFWVALVAAATAAAVWRAKGGPLAALWPREHGRIVVAMGLIFLVNSVTFLGAYERTTVANAVFTHYTAPVLVALLAPATLGERRLPATPWALALATVGMVLLWPAGGLAWGSRHFHGVVLGLVSGVAYAVLVLLARHLSPRLSPLRLLFAQNAVVVATLFPFAAPHGLPSAGDGALLVLLGVGLGTGAALLYLAGLARVGAQTAAVLGYLEPVAAVALAAAVLGEFPAPLALGGGALVVAGGLLVVWDEGRHNAIDGPWGNG